jgi:hypothetical protein
MVTFLFVYLYWLVGQAERVDSNLPYTVLPPSPQSINTKIQQLFGTTKYIP